MVRSGTSPSCARSVPPCRPCHCSPPDPTCVSLPLHLAHRAAVDTSCCSWETASRRSGEARSAVCHATLPGGSTAAGAPGRQLHCSGSGTACRLKARRCIEVSTLSSEPACTTLWRPPHRFAGLMQRYFGQYRPAVQAVAGDRAEHLVWRMQNGALPTRKQVRRVPDLHCCCACWAGRASAAAGRQACCGCSTLSSPGARGWMTESPACYRRFLSPSAAQGGCAAHRHQRPFDPGQYRARHAQ